MNKTVDFVYPWSSEGAQRIVNEVAEQTTDEFTIRSFHDEKGLQGGDFLFALSFPRMIGNGTLSKYELPVVLHASDLPRGRGWSPANWAAENLETEIIISAIRMVEAVDSGNVLAKVKIDFPLSDIWSDLQPKLEKVQADLIVGLITDESPVRMEAPQEGVPTHLRRRSLTDSEVLAHISLADQWGKIRASDPKRYPNYFEHLGRTFKLTVEPWEDKPYENRQ